MKIINHDIRSVNGKYIMMPAWKAGQSCGDIGWSNLAIPSPYEIAATASYPIGTKFVDDDRVWRYCQAGNAITAGRIALSYNRFGTATSGDGTTAETGTIAAAASDGDSTITCTDQGSAVTANLYAGGYCTIYWEFQVKRIESNTAESTAGTFVLTLDAPLDQDISSSSVVTVYRDIYADVRLSAGVGSRYGAGVCVPPKTVTDAYYFWGQTWGPCGIAGVDNFGAGTNEVAVYDHNQAAYFQTSIHATNNYPAAQFIGHSLAFTGNKEAADSGTDQPGALIFVMLQLAP